MKATEAGLADIWGIIDGKHIEIEVKTPSYKYLSKKQKNFKKTVEKAGSIFIIYLQDTCILSELSKQGIRRNYAKRKIRTDEEEKEEQESGNDAETSLQEKEKSLGRTSIVV